MQRWLLGQGTAKELGVNLDAELNRLGRFESVSFKVNGVEKRFAMDEIRRRAAMETSCKNCLELQLEVDALKAQLKRPVEAPLQAVVRKYIDDNYERTFDRSYSRRTLLKEIDDFLLKTYNKRIHKGSPLWSYVIREVLGNHGKDFKRLKIRKKPDR